MVHSNDLVLGGWNISGVRLDKAMQRAKVLDYDFQCQAPLAVAQGLSLRTPLPFIYLLPLIKRQRTITLFLYTLTSDHWQKVHRNVDKSQVV